MFRFFTMRSGKCNDGRQVGRSFFRSWGTETLNFWVSWSVLNIMRKLYSIYIKLYILFNKDLYNFKIKLYKGKFFIKDYRRKCEKILRKMRIWSHLLRKSLQKLVRNLTFATVQPTTKVFIQVLIKTLNHQLFCHKIYYY